MLSPDSISPLEGLMEPRNHYVIVTMYYIAKEHKRNEQKEKACGTKSKSNQLQAPRVVPNSVKQDKAFKAFSRELERRINAPGFIRSLSHSLSKYENSSCPEGKWVYSTDHSELPYTG